ncbi:MAG: BolA/IbaG family iron-sulfur metabolism protein [Arenicellales bacterium]|jgi:BolA protein|nr:BolA/IbaG family iron-sulfur metabolism protein [Arenicellales bacterium]|tara:strand:+ start:2629 stop:2892 length:264 start_codon:yes stop_codon:yes gene_type:complete
MSDRAQRIESLLRTAFSPSKLEIIDESHLHAGHAGAAGGGGHFRVVIASEQFSGLSTVASHRLIYQALDEMLPEEIHALSLQLTSAT